MKRRSGRNPTTANALKIKKNLKIPKHTAEETAAVATDRRASILQSMVSPIHLLPNCETRRWPQSPSLLLNIIEANPEKPALETAEDVGFQRHIPSFTSSSLAGDAAHIILEPLIYFSYQFI